MHNKYGPTTKKERRKEEEGLPRKKGLGEETMF